jgi:undecaprenyl-diphosphatase
VAYLSGEAQAHGCKVGLVERENRALIAGFAAALAALLFFGWLADAVLGGETGSFDAAVRGTVHGWASPHLTSAMRALTWLGSEMVMVPLGALLFCWLSAAGRRHAAILLILAGLGAEALNLCLKLFFQRPRPGTFFGYPQPETYSFPSGHAMVSFCFYGALAAILTTRMESRGGRITIWTGAAILAAAIGLSRVYLGVHYPSDVIAGYAAGAVWVGAVSTGYAIWLRRRRSTFQTNKELIQ